MTPHPDPGATPPEPQGTTGQGGLRAMLVASGGGFATSLITTILAFLVGGLVVLATGHNPLLVYKGIFNGTGLNWFFPWVDGIDRVNAAFNLQQTLLFTTTLILTGLAVAFAFRCGLFNIGGQGQWIVGASVSVWVGSSWSGLAGPAHIILAIVLAMLAGAVWAGIAGLLKATRGVHEVISTIMLNWIAIYACSYLFGLGGPLQNDVNESVPISNDIVEGAKLRIIWGDPVLQGLHIGLLIALGMLVVYWLTLSRTTLGFKVRAVGKNAEAARYGGINVGYSYFMAMAVSGAFAGLGGAMDILGWQFRLGELDIRTSTVGFIGIAVALLGRNTAIGVMFSAFLFGALLYGTSSRSLDPTVFQPQLAGNLTLMIQAMVLLFIGADLLILWLWKHRGIPRLRLPKRIPKVMVTPEELTAEEHEVVALDVPEARRPPFGERLQHRLMSMVPRGAHGLAVAGMVIAVASLLVAIPPFTARSVLVPIAVAVIAAAVGGLAATRGELRLGLTAVGLAVVFGAAGIAATQSSVGNLESVVTWSALTASMLRFATPLIFAGIGGMFSERSGVVNIGLEGMMLSGAFFGILGAEKTGSWVLGVLSAIIAGALIASIHAVISIHLRADQIVSGTAINFLALGLTGYLFIDIYGSEGTPGGIPAIPDVSLGFLRDVPFFGGAFGDLNLLIWVAFLLVIVAYYVMFRTPFGLRLRAVGEHPRAAETVGLSVYRIRYTGVIISGMLASLGGAFLSIGFVDSFGENMTNGAGFIALAALIVGNWKPRGVFLAALLIGLGQAVGQRLPVYSESAAILFESLPYVITLIAVAGLVGRPRPPAAIGIPYERS
ncbi:MAG: hypothetical protein R2878_06855 [Thermoleophilia bacterium]